MDQKLAVAGERPSPEKRSRQPLVLLLSCAAGAVDVASYIGLGHVFAANMTGNTVHLGMAVGQTNAGDVGRAAAALVGFLGGAALGALIVERDDSPAPWPRSVTIALAVELALLLAVAALWHSLGVTRTADALLLGLGLAMGMQSIAIRRLRIPGVVSTYLSGTLTTLMAGLMRRAEGKTRPAPEAPTHGTLLLASVWLIYAVGAALNTIVSPSGGPLLLALPAFLVAVVLVGRSGDWRVR